MLFSTFMCITVLICAAANAITAPSNVLKGKIQLRGGNGFSKAYAGGIATAVSHTLMLPMGMNIL